MRIPYSKHGATLDTRRVRLSNPFDRNLLDLRLVWNTRKSLVIRPIYRLTKTSISATVVDISASHGVRGVQKLGRSKRKSSASAHGSTAWFAIRRRGSSVPRARKSTRPWMIAGRGWESISVCEVELGYFFTPPSPARFGRRTTGAFWAPRSCRESSNRRVFQSYLMFPILIQRTRRRCTSVKLMVSFAVPDMLPAFCASTTVP